VKQSLDYLKIRLANPAAEAFGTTISVDGIPFVDAVAALSAFYLAAVLWLSKAAALKAFEKDLGKGRTLNWRVNIGVPVKHYDSQVLQVFRRVAAVAWAWQDRQPFNPTVKDLIELYKTTDVSSEPSDLPIQVVPELSAALIHVAEHRNSPEGIYGFLDIGGGTLDGSVFELRREIEGTQVRILAADVEELGTMAVARHVVAGAHRDMAGLVEKPLILGDRSPTIKLPLSEQIEERVQGLFASVMSAARGKISIETENQGRPGLNRPKAPIIPVYLAGGGAQSEWYRQLFERLHKDFNHGSAWGIGGYKIETIPNPAGLNDADYPRFVVASGLTSDAIDFERYRLPSRTKPISPPLPRPPAGPNYNDTKELT
jgi:hypothetical protein